MLIDRSFVRIDEGLVHYRHNGNNARAAAGDSDSDALPILMMHPSPASSSALEPLINSLGKNPALNRKLIAPDTLGCGDSAAPAPEQPDINYYAGTMLRSMDALGVNRFDIYGSHTGAHIGIELALLAPTRVNRLILDGVAVLSAEDKQDYLANYAPRFAPDAHGGQFSQVWQYVRDQMVFFPHYRKDDQHRRFGGNFSAGFLHELSLDLLKNLTHYHKTYHAVFNHDVLARAAELRCPIMLLTSEHDPLGDFVKPLAQTNSAIEVVSLPDESNDGKADAIGGFLNQD